MLGGKASVWALKKTIGVLGMCRMYHGSTGELVGYAWRQGLPSLCLAKDRN